MSQTPQAVIDKLFEIQENNPPQEGIMAFAKEYIEIDLQSRTVGAPEFLSVAKDHKFENVYFIVNRYWDYMDLATTTCVISYKTESGAAGLYAVPFYDLRTAKAPAGSLEPDKMILPWCIDGRVTENAGLVEFAVRFYRIDINGKKLIYNLNTMPGTSKVLYGLDVSPDGLEDADDLVGDYDISTSLYDYFAQEIADVRKQDVFWIEYN